MEGQKLAGVRVSHLIVEGQRVARYWDELNRCQGRAVKSAITDEDGFFELLGVDQRPGILLLDKVGFARTSVKDVLPSATVQTFALEPEGVIEGRMQTAGGTPVADAWITTRKGEESFPSLRPDQLGEFHIGGLPSGEYELRFSRSGGYQITRTVELARGEVRRLEIVEDVGVIFGRVTQGGEGLAQADVTIEGEQGGRGQTQTVSQGRYRVSGLPPGQYDVRASFRRRGQRTYGVEGPRKQVTVGDGETECDLEFSSGAIRGQVVDYATGVPVPGARLTLYVHDPERQGNGFFIGVDENDWHPLASKDLAEGDHQFEFLNIEAGTYLIVAHGPEGASGYVGPLAVGHNQSLKAVDLLAGGSSTVDVTVKSTKSGAAVTGALVILWPLGGLPFQLGASTDAGGVARIDNIPSGRCQIAVRHKNHATYLKEIDVSGGVFKTDATLEIGSFVVVQFQGAEFRQNPYGIVVTALSGDPGWRYKTVKDGLPMSLMSGASERRLLSRPGEYRIRLDIRPPSVSLKEEPVFSKEVDIAIPKGGEIQVMIP